MKFFREDYVYFTMATHINKNGYSNNKICKLDSGAAISCLTSSMIASLYQVEETRLVDQLMRSNTPKAEFASFDGNHSQAYFMRLLNIYIDDFLWKEFFCTVHIVTEDEIHFAEQHGRKTDRFLVGTDTIHCCDGIIQGNDYIELNVIDPEKQKQYVMNYLTEHGLGEHVFGIDEIAFA